MECFHTRSNHFTSCVLSLQEKQISNIFERNYHVKIWRKLPCLRTSAYHAHNIATISADLNQSSCFTSAVTVRTPPTVPLNHDPRSDLIRYKCWN